MSSLLIGALRAPSTLTISLAAMTVFIASTASARQSAGCTAGANHVSQATPTAAILTAFSNAASAPSAGCPACGVLVTADGTGVTQANLGSLGANAGLIAPDGVFGTFTLSSAIYNGTNPTQLAARLDGLLNKACTSATITVNASGFPANAIAVLDAQIAKIDVITNLPAGSSLTLTAAEANGKVISGAGSIILSSHELAGQSNLTGITTPALVFPGSAPYLSIASGGMLAAYPERLSGVTIGGAGTVSLVGAVTTDVNLAGVTAGLSVDADGVPGTTVAAGRTLTLGAAQASDKSIGGAGTTVIAGDIAASADFTGITTALGIPGAVEDGATLTLTAAQGNTRALQGAGSVRIAPVALATNADFCNLSTGGFAITGSVEAGATLTIMAAQSAGCVLTGAGTVEILCTAAADSVGGDIDARVVVSGLDGDDTLASGDAADSISGGDGDDSLQSGAGNDSIDGGAGSDTAVFASTLGGASFGAPSATLAISSAADGSDSLVGVEILAFADKTVYTVGAGGAFTDFAAALSGAPAGSAFFGHLAINASTPGFTDTAALQAILARCVAGSTYAVDMAGMSAAQVAAVNSAYQTLSSAISNAPVTISRGSPAAAVGQAPTIEAAVEFASAGDVVDVAAGSFAISSPIAVTKPLSIRGARHGVDARTRTGSESVVDASGVSGAGGAGFAIAPGVSGVTIDGFTVSGVVNGVAGIHVGEGSSGNRIANNIITGNSTGLVADNDDATAPTIVERNRFDSNTAPGAASGKAISIDEITAGGDLAGLVIRENSFANAAALADFAIVIDNEGPAAFTAITIADNAFEATTHGVLLVGIADSAISGNTFRSDFAIELSDGRSAGVVASSNIAIVANTFDAVDSGIRISDSGFGAYSGTLAPAGNIFTGSTRVLRNEGAPAVIAAAGNTFDGVPLDGATAKAGIFAIADLVRDEIDSPALGRVVLRDGNRYVTAANTVANGLATALAGETVHIQAGAYADGAVTVDASGLSVDAEAGATGFSLVLGGADSIVLAGAADIDVAGNAADNTMTANAGANDLDGAAGVDTAIFAGDAPVALAAGSTILVGADSVTGVEKLVFDDATIVLVGTGGSAYADLNAAQAATTSERLFGTLAVDADTQFTSAADLLALLARFVEGSTLTLDVADMSVQQLAAVAGNESAFPGFAYPPVRVSATSVTKGYFTAIQPAIDFASAGDTLHVAAGTYAGQIGVHKNVAVLGPNDQVEGSDAREPEAVLDLTGVVPSGPAAITLSQGALRGFRIVDNTVPSSAGERTALHLSGAASSEVADNIFFRDSGLDAPAGHAQRASVFRAIHIEQSAGGGATVSRNLFAGASGGLDAHRAWSHGISTSGGAAAVSIVDNRFDEVLRPLTVQDDMSMLSIAGNTFNGAGATMLRIGFSGAPGFTDASTVSPGLTLGSNAFIDPGTLFDLAGVPSGFVLDATASVLDGVAFANLGRAGHMDIAARSLQRVTDPARNGRVVSKAGEVHVPSTAATLAGGIGRAIEVASALDIVHVAAGEFSDRNLAVSKPLSFKGANAGVNPNTGVRGAETVISGAAATDKGFLVNSGVASASVDGFRFVGCSPIHDGNEMGFPRSTAVEFRNNISENGAVAFSGISTSWDAVTIAGNRFVNSNATPTTSALQIQAARVATISGNVILNSAYAAILLDGVDSASVTGNSIDGTAADGIQLANAIGSMGDSTIDGNTIVNANASLGADRGAIRLYGSGLAGTTAITNNIISASHNGIAIKDGSSIAGRVITLSGNAITVGSGSSVYHGGTGDLDFTGANTVNGIAVAGAPLADLFAVSGTITDGLDVAGKGLVRIKSGAVHVVAAGSIELGIAAAAEGDIVHVEAGAAVVLTGVITKNVTVAGSFTIGAGSIPTGPTASAVLGSLISRGASGASSFSASLGGMSADQLAAVGDHASSFSGPAPGAIVLTSAHSGAQIAGLMGLATDGAVSVVATGMGDAQLNAIAAQAGKVAADGITGTMLVTSAIADANLGALLGKASVLLATVEVNASGMSDGELSALAMHDARVDEIANLRLGSSQTIAEMNALIGKSVAAASTGKAMAVVDATSMDAAKLTAVAGFAARIGTDGIGGAVLLGGGIADADLTALFGKIAASAQVRVNGAGLGAATITLVAANLAKVDSAFAMHLTSAQTVAELAQVLGISDTASASANATGMDSSAGGKLATLSDHHAKFIAAGITGTFSISSGLTATQIANLLGKVDYGTGSSFLPPASITVDATGMSVAQLASLATGMAGAGSAANQNSVFDINNLALGSAHGASVIATLLNATNPGEATVNATGMTTAQLIPLGNMPGAIDLITGTVQITAGLSAAQIQAIIGNISPSASNLVVNTNGMSAAQQAAIYTTSILLAEITGTVATGNAIVAEINLSGLPQLAVGAQLRVLYDATKLQFAADLANGDADGDGLIDGIGGTAFPQTLYYTQAPGMVTFATGVDINGAGTGVTEGNIARLPFRAIAPFCGASGLVTIATSGFQCRVTDNAGVPMPFLAVSSSHASSVNNLQLAGIPASNVSVPADAGTTAGAGILRPTVTASNNCESSVPVTMSISYPSGATGTTWPERFPIGASTVTWSATDSGGNTTSSSRTYTVENHQLLAVDVNIAGSIPAGIAFSQPIRLRLSSGDTVTVTVPFVGSDGGVVETQIPARDDYTCITAKDPGGTLADSRSLVVSGTRYVASTAFSLVSGDSDDDNVVDILDFGTLLADRGFGKNPSSRSNFNRDQAVDNADFTFIGINFLKIGDTCGGGNLDGNAEPLARISVKELRRRGLGHLEVADIDMDGWVDENDMGLAMQGHVRRDNPTEPSDADSDW